MASYVKLFNILYVAIVCIGNFATGGARQPPNIVFILVDDFGWDDASFHGSNQIPTPNLDALAYDGIILNSYYVQPICTPSRAALMTGRHPIHLGLQHYVIDGSQPYGLRTNETIMPQYLKNLGYDTHMIGKWHLGFYAKELTPTYRGFDTFFGYLNGAEDYWDHTSQQGRPNKWGLDWRRANGHEEEMIKDNFGQYSTLLYTKEAEDVISQHDISKPMYMYVAQQAPHNGNAYMTLQAPDEYLERFSYIHNKRRRTYAAMVSAMDESVGNITKALHARGMLNNTIIAFSTDNGGPADGYCGNDASNWPLRGMKNTLWEGGMRGNGFIWSPLLNKSQYVYEGKMEIADWLPTLLNAAGYDQSKLPKNIDGFDLWNVLSNNQESPRTEIFHNADYVWRLAALRVDDMKIVKGQRLTHKYDKWYRPDLVTSEKASTNPTGAAEDIQPEIESDLKFGEPVHQLEEAPEHMFHSDLYDIFLSLGRSPPKRTPVVVTCPHFPANATTSCREWENYCLFNITADPCEYYDLAQKLPHVLNQMIERLNQYNSTATKPQNINLPQDPRGFPQKHDGFWVPWMNLTNAEQSKEARLSLKPIRDMSNDI